MRASTDQGTVELVDGGGVALGTASNPVEVGQVSVESLFAEMLRELKGIKAQLELITETKLD